MYMNVMNEQTRMAWIASSLARGHSSIHDIAGRSFDLLFGAASAADRCRNELHFTWLGDQTEVGSRSFRCIKGHLSSSSLVDLEFNISEDQRFTVAASKSKACPNHLHHAEVRPVRARTLGTFSEIGKQKMKALKLSEQSL